MNDRSIRSLAHLQGSAATSRTLNLHAIWEKTAGDEAYQASPFFDDPGLNRAIILKHRLRRNEGDQFNGWRTSATKVIMPIDASNLKAGGQYFFIGQRGYDTLVRSLFARGAKSSRDLQLLNILDELPSFDPFLMSERLKRLGYRPARCYFDVSEARMFAFVHRELQPLIGVSYEADANFTAHTSVLATKILSNSVDSELDPLRRTLNLGVEEFQEGVFCWKGFLYYKWNLSETLPKLVKVLNEIATIKPSTVMERDARIALEQSREAIRRTAAVVTATVEKTLKVYENAFADLAHNSKPLSFRAFLLDAPGLFAELGERLGAVNHIVSFWRYRFPIGQMRTVTPAELLDMFADFESSLNFSETRNGQSAPGGQALAI
jgi:hypothetical protein